MVKSIIGSIIGGILVFVWLFISWGVLKLHQPSIHDFKDESAVMAALRTQIDEDGVYVLPSKKDDAAIAQGPFVFASIRKGEFPGYSLQKQLLRAFSATVVSAIVLGIMLHFAAAQLNYFGRLIFVILGGIFVALAGIYPLNIWWELSVSFTLTMIIDAVVGWFFAGVVMAGICGGKSKPYVPEGI